MSPARAYVFLADSNDGLRGTVREKMYRYGHEVVGEGVSTRDALDKLTKLGDKGAEVDVLVMSGVFWNASEVAELAKKTFPNITIIGMLHPEMIHEIDWTNQTFDKTAVGLLAEAVTDA
jgi:hypothetical protein